MSGDPKDREPEQPTTLGVHSPPVARPPGRLVGGGEIGENRRLGHGDSVPERAALLNPLEKVPQTHRGQVQPKRHWIWRGELAVVGMLVELVFDDGGSW